MLTEGQLFDAVRQALWVAVIVSLPILVIPTLIPGLSLDMLLTALLSLLLLRSLERIPADGVGGVRLPSQSFGIGPYEDNLYQTILKKKI